MTARYEINATDRLPIGVYQVYWYLRGRRTKSYDGSASVHYVRRVAAGLRPDEGIVAVCTSPQPLRFAAGMVE